MDCETWEMKREIMQLKTILYELTRYIVIDTDILDSMKEEYL